MAVFTAVCFTSVSCLRPAAADEWEQNSPYYEDDAWYDISEWLDGNDYNPTDEAWGRWDDEQYDTADAATSRDVDSDRQYGFDQSDASDDWYYDYQYDPWRPGYLSSDDNNVYDYSWEYYDFDNDGTFDAYSSYQDVDGDGTYEQYDYYAFNVDEDSNVAAKPDTSHKQAAERQKSRSSKGVVVNGNVDKAKKLEVRGAHRWVAHVQGDDGSTRIVDFGPVGQFDSEVKKGQKVMAKGPLLKVGDHEVVLAQSASIGDQGEQRINRSGRKFKGQINKTKTVKVRGQDHQMVILNLESGKQALVDLGEQDKLDIDLKESDQIEVSGIPVKVKDRVVVLAHSVTKGGDKTEISRVAARESSKPKS